MTIESSRQLRYVADSRQLPIPMNLQWLSAAERTEMAYWSNANRRQQWLAGRWLSKRLIARKIDDAQLRRVEILSRDQNGLGTSPRVSIDGVAQQSHLSISHAGNAILVGWSPRAGTIGVDLAMAVPHDQSFLSSWYSPRERAWIAERNEPRAAVLWGLKEAIFKACGSEKKWNPTAIAIDSLEDGHVQGHFQGEPLPRLRSWIKTVSGGVATAVWMADDHTEVSLCS